MNALRAACDRAPMGLMAFAIGYFAFACLDVGCRWMWP